MISENEFDNSTLNFGDLDLSIEDSELYKTFNGITYDVFSIKVCREWKNDSSIFYAYVNYSSKGKSQYSIC